MNGIFLFYCLILDAHFETREQLFLKICCGMRVGVGQINSGSHKSLSSVKHGDRTLNGCKIMKRVETMHMDFCSSVAMNIFQVFDQKL